jgi:hypothetical protein
MNFDILAFADYSGASDTFSQKRHIKLATGKNGSNKIKITGGYTRVDLHNIIIDILVGASKNNKRVLFGFDHNYTFPDGFFQAITDNKNLTWQQFIKMVHQGIMPFDGLGKNPRNWATDINKILQKKYKISSGPFWGPHFSPLKKPAGIFDSLPFAEKRIVEGKLPRMKPIFQLGGIGSVGLQSLYGIWHLSNIISFADDNHIPLHCWPYAGIKVPMDKHVLIEIYPGFYNKEIKSDANDAQNTVRFFLEQQKKGTLSALFHIPDDAISVEKIKQEGWLPGI